MENFPSLLRNFVQAKFEEAYYTQFMKTLVISHLNGNLVVKVLTEMRFERIIKYPAQGNKIKHFSFKNNILQ